MLGLLPRRNCCRFSTVDSFPLVLVAFLFFAYKFDRSREKLLRVFGILLAGSRISTIVRLPYRRRISLKIAGIDTRVDALRSEIYKTSRALAEHVSHFSYRLSRLPRLYTPITFSLPCIFVVSAHNRR